MADDFVRIEQEGARAWRYLDHDGVSPPQPIGAVELGDAAEATPARLRAFSRTVTAATRLRHRVDELLAELVTYRKTVREDARDVLNALRAQQERKAAEDREPSPPD